MINNALIDFVCIYEDLITCRHTHPSFITSSALSATYFFLEEEEEAFVACSRLLPPACSLAPCFS